MDDQEIGKLLEKLSNIANDYDCELGLPVGPGFGSYPEERLVGEKLTQAVRDWLIGQSESFHWIDYKSVIIIPEEWLDKENEELE